jgi:dGTPase
MDYTESVRRAVRRALESGHRDLSAVLRYCEGADPSFVVNLLTEELAKPATNVPAAIAIEDPMEAFLARRMPAPDPGRSQWWFTSNGIRYITELVDAEVARNSGGQVLCLGAPTVGQFLSTRSYAFHVLDSDPEVLRALDPFPSNGRGKQYDAADTLPSDLECRFEVVVLDPPWYGAAIRTFLIRALMALKPDGSVFCVLPPRLTRPGVEEFRSELTAKLVAAGHEIVLLQRESIQYLVPRFELVALGRRLPFKSIPWRAGDLLQIRKRGAAIPFTAELKKSSTRAYFRNANQFRVLVAGTATSKSKTELEFLDGYSSNISTRAHADEVPDLWTTEKVGVRVRDIKCVELALAAWQDRRDEQGTIERLVAAGVATAMGEQLVAELNKCLGLWSHFAAAPTLRTEEQIVEHKKQSLSEWATPPTSREHGHESDSYRGWYQRDRDRVLWSTAFRRLTNKTQLFPFDYDDTVRQRLAHSLEVLQLASTIGASFGLDRDLIEAGALAHDIGHTPFGHAGEHALSKLLNLLNPDLGGFNHYEHGVDVLRWLEAPYYESSSTHFFGLNLLPEVSECVFKHTYCHAGLEESSLESLLARTKHPINLIKKGHCHLEGQAVRLADKVSYLISDLEDGIRLGAITISDLAACQFFHRPPLDFFQPEPGALHRNFLVQRRLVVKLIMEDVLQATSRNLARLKPKTNVRELSDYVVNYSEDMAADVDEIWNRLQRARLHSDRRVVAANLQAAKIVTELTLALALFPNLVDSAFRKEHERLWGTAYLDYYKNRGGNHVSVSKQQLAFMPHDVMIGRKSSSHNWEKIRTEELIMAKDLVAALTDSRARSLHRQILGGRSGEATT